MALERVLKLTSPLVEGADVRAAQRFLSHSKYGSFYEGEITGRYGEATAGATRHAKYMLGYPRRNRDPSKKLNQQYDRRLALYLRGETKLGVMHRYRRRKRLAKQKRALMVRAFNEAAKWVGTKENPPDSNRVKFSTWYGMIGPWCAMFVTYCYVQVGSKAFIEGRQWAYVPYILSAARQGLFGLSVTKSPVQGALVLFDWDGDGVADHIGLFDKWVTQGTSFRTIEGNTSADTSGSQSNGGQVARRERYTSQVIAFILVTQ